VVAAAVADDDVRGPQALLGERARAAQEREDVEFRPAEPVERLEMTEQRRLVTAERQDRVDDDDRSRRTARCVEQSVERVDRDVAPAARSTSGACTRPDPRTGTSSDKRHYVSMEDFGRDSTRVSIRRSPDRRLEVDDEGRPVASAEDAD
jgi:hypothetical protein